MSENDFYIGWQDKAPDRFAKHTKKVIFFLIGLVVLVALLYVPNQKEFFNSHFEFGSFTEIKGIVYSDPVPMIKVAVSEGEYQNFLLFGYGKSDAHKTIDLLKSQTENLEDYWVTLESELIFYDGKTLLEVPVEKNKMDTFEKIQGEKPKRVIKDLGEVSLKGEIVDPKCYFGAMKPGYGKIHRSCGIRCISGGIPPVFVTRSEEGTSDYFLVLGENGEKINEEILQFVGDSGCSERKVGAGR